MHSGRVETFWRDLSEISQQAQQIQTDYQASRDALLVRHGADCEPELKGLWTDYCECLARLKEVIADLGQVTDQPSGTR